jgi:hypothetical protein
MATEGTKCAHPNCSCQAAKGSDYCSEQCESTAKTPHSNCECGHAACKCRIG